MKFKTENLYLVKICNLVKIEETDIGTRRYWEHDGRYTLAYLKDGQFNTLMTFVDIYTHTSYLLVDNTYYFKIETSFILRYIYHLIFHWKKFLNNCNNLRFD